MNKNKLRALGAKYIKNKRVHVFGGKIKQAPSLFFKPNTYYVKSPAASY